jgi:ribosomal protein L7Ae-like RNA K-turn-binding protein
VFRRPVAAPRLDAVCGGILLAFHDRLGSCLSIAQKAGKLVSGNMSLRQACRRSKVTYMVLAEDASVQRAAEYRTWCADLNIPHVTMFSKDELGRRIGKASRSAVGLLDPRFRESFCATLNLLQTFEASLDCLEIGVGLMPQLKQAVDG